ncbi:MAG TPA: HAD hydrolase family protein [Pseudomonadales bacterium]|nr:HAD hydrolase family protein [Pseudomonadales bacterium]MCP5332887.1 HAD hydrolase family protein [Pseudomonadales bacterium]HMU89545.1 HAD hydrolase family protein [Pseudomonadales bacterium]HMW14691.1 HAD hydrolase family protein [Pseudomonadales bacterium]HMW82788.1 HAD hydrolase family protein [Pseudomonadales bacterium]
MSDKLLQKIERIRLLALDVDGVLTDGRLYFLPDGGEIKVFNSLDGHGLKMLQRSGVTVALITGRSSTAVARRAAELGISHLHQGSEQKLPIFDGLLEQLGLDYSQAAFMGDDLPDLPLIRRAAVGMTVANAHPLVRQSADWQSTLAGGQGAVREACDLIMQTQGTLCRLLQAYE